MPLSWPMSTTMMVFLVIAVIAVLLLNAVSFLLYRSDKLRASKGEWRVPENRLLLVSLLGPFGAYYSMKRYRHKTKKLKFKLVPVFMFIQVALVVFLLLSQYQAPAL
ncbi:MAG: DUF1294 domain-containing protein [Methanomassiliicoccales archaeon]|nr:DUF1294 domain-containing protein [Methanomassiliicoccales archaeon]